MIKSTLFMIILAVAALLIFKNAVKGFGKLLIVVVLICAFIFFILPQIM